MNNLDRTDELILRAAERARFPGLRALTLTAVTGLALSSWASAAPQPTPRLHYSAETYGASTGAFKMAPESMAPVMEQFGGLVIELVRPNTRTQALRVFGGIPESGAAIVIGMKPGPVYEGGLTRHVDRVVQQVVGTFDPWGYFEYPLGDLPPDQVNRLRGAELYAQGICVSIAGTYYSNGINISARPAVERRLSLHDFVPQLPEDRREKVLGSMQQIELIEALRQGLNGPGDSMNVRLDASLTSNFGFPGVDVGGKIALDAKVSRNANGTYDVAIDREVAMLAGAKLPGTQIKASGANGIARRMVYRFYSADGAVHGMLGIAFAQAWGGGIDLPELDRDGVSPLQRAYDASRIAMQRAQARVAAAQGALQRAELAHRIERKRWRRAARAVVVRVCRVGLRVAHAGLSVALDVQARAKAKLDEAKEKFAVVFARLRMLRNCIWKATQVFTFADQHRHGSELRFTSSAGFQVSLGLGPVSLPNIGFGLSAAMEREFVVYREFSRHAGQPERLTVRVRQAKKLAAHGSIAQVLCNRLRILNAAQLPWDETTAQVINSPAVKLIAEIASTGGEAKMVRYVEFEASFDLRLTAQTAFTAGSLTGQRGVFHTGTRLRFGMDLEATHLMGYGACTARGVGRQMSLTLPAEDVLASLGDAGQALLDRDPADLLRALASLHGTVKVQDRYKTGASAGMGISAEVLTVGVNAAATWTDAGDPIAEDISIGDCVERGAQSVRDTLQMVLPAP